MELTSKTKTAKRIPTYLLVLLLIALIGCYEIRGKVTKHGAGVEGVTVVLSGDSTQTTQTDSEGYFVFSALLDGNYEVKPSFPDQCFEPASTLVQIAGQDVSDVHFEADLCDQELPACPGCPTLKGELRSVKIWGDGYQQEVTAIEIDGLVLLEGDIVLGTPDEFEPVSSVSGNNSVSSPSIISSKSIMVRSVTSTWPGGFIPFQVHPNVPLNVRQGITAAIQHWEDNTVIDFVPRDVTNQHIFPDYVVFRGDSDECAANVGRTGGEQYVWLGPQCGAMGTVTHEIGHVVGLWHEQSRSDRDQHVRINLENMNFLDAEVLGNFVHHIPDGVDMGPYDYDSIMHYRRNAFSINGLPTIEPIDSNGNPDPSIQIGVRGTLSAGDIAAVDSMYSRVGTYSGPASIWHPGFSPAGEVPNVGDFNGDGLDDIVTFTGTGLVWVALSNGSGYGQAIPWHSAFYVHGEVPDVGDFNGDGLDDIVTFTGTGLVWVALSNGSSFGQAFPWHFGFYVHGEVPRVGDFNGDGLDDIVTFTGTGLVYVAFSVGWAFGPAAPWHFGFYVHGEWPDVGDFNGDGLDDIVSFTRNGPVWVALSVGAGFGVPLVWHDGFAPAPEIPRVGDIDGDGNDDIVTFTGTGFVWVADSLAATGATFGQATVWHCWFAPAPEWPDVGDFNGDGIDDIVTFVQGNSGLVWAALTQRY